MVNTRLESNSPACITDWMPCISKAEALVIVAGLFTYRVHAMNIKTSLNNSLCVLSDQHQMSTLLKFSVLFLAVSLNVAVEIHRHLSHFFLVGH